MVLKDIINKLLGNYQREILNVIGMFNSTYGIKNPSKYWRIGKIDRIGFLDITKMVEYTLHGGGVTVEFDKGKLVSFDFDQNDDYTFDPYKFQLFIETDESINIDKTSIIKFIENNELNVIKNNGRWELV
jgi:hypothetical protein